ncbi:type VI secretion protein Vgr [Variovorax sp. Root318D1]|uniref:type VI secretion system Vgr family protein n=1 Tax=Variovorax sp. Root318D1 TaxID=1736513 RepID=UPI0006F2CA90|nr:type VI secretion system tip protein TssI/VgrG [Variovorax sp. Root318D1]KQU86499.1 type VI secretion protein Vgr [Variovorax sp. Root318D1]
MERVVKVHSPLGGDQLMFRSMHGSEGLSRLFEFEVDLLSPRPSIDAQSVLGKALTLELRTTGEPRFLDGQVVRFSMVGREGGTSRHTVYRATVRPWLWYLTRSSDNRIFQSKSVVEILEEVFGDYGFAFEKKLSGTYRCWEYCVQYNESDFAFVSRLMELEGIYYYFKHEKNQHTLVLADDIGAHEAMPGYETIDYFAADRPITEDMEVIDDWQMTEEVRTGSYTVDDFNFTTPKGDLSSIRSQPHSHDNAGYDMYEWLGEHTDSGQAEHYARVRLEEAQSLAQRSNGHATVRGMAPGRTFTLRNAPRGDDNGEYLIISVSYALREGGYATGSAPGSYGFGFVAQPATNPFRAPRQTPMPRTSGPQTATVVGPEGEEIWTDQYGRVKLQFHWDRAGLGNENSSSWVRVSQAWAGEGFGTVHLPRIGQEVVVDFIGGHIDRPIVVGRVYNADQMPPFDLPGEATKSGIVSRSSKGGAVANANAILFEDAMGAERVLLHAERNLDVEVEGDETHTTNKTRTTLIKGHESSTFEAGEERHITSGAVETIDGGEERTVTGGATETVTDGETRMISGGATETISGGETRLVDGGIVETDNGGVIVTINGTVLRLVSGADIRITGSGRVEIINAVDITLVQGPKLKTVLGPKFVYAPSMLNVSTNYSVNTTNFKLNATVTVVNTPDQTVNSDDQCWLRHVVREGYLHQMMLVGNSLERFGNKIQLAHWNTLLQVGAFVNISGLNWIQSQKKSDVPWTKVKAAAVALRTGMKRKTTTGAEIEA